MNGSFLYTVDNIHAVYITAVILLCMVGLVTPIDTHSNLTVLTTVYSLCSWLSGKESCGVQKLLTKNQCCIRIEETVTTKVLPAYEDHSSTYRMNKDEDHISIIVHVISE